MLYIIRFRVHISPNQWQSDIDNIFDRKVLCLPILNDVYESM